MAIAVLDFGGQYARLIVTKVRALGVHAEIREPDDPIDTYRGYRGLILSGSPALSARDEEAGLSRGVLDLGAPVLGFCFGHQEIAKHAGGAVEHTKREQGPATLHSTAPSPLFEGLRQEELVWMSHGDTVTRLAASPSTPRPSPPAPSSGNEARMPRRGREVGRRRRRPLAQSD